MNNFLSAETRKLKSKKEIIKMEEIKEKLRAFIQEKFEIDDDPDFTDDVHLFNEGFVDSFGAVEIIHFIEQTYNIEITQKDITLYPMNTIEEIAEVVENKTFYSLRCNDTDFRTFKADFQKRFRT